jgi:hypothetical protein
VKVQDTGNHQKHKVKIPQLDLTGVSGSKEITQEPNPADITQGIMEIEKSINQGGVKDKVKGNDKRADSGTANISKMMMNNVEQARKPDAPVQEYMRVDLNNDYRHPVKHEATDVEPRPEN